MKRMISWKTFTVAVVVVLGLLPGFPGGLRGQGQTQHPGDMGR